MDPSSEHLIRLLGALVFVGGGALVAGRLLRRVHGRQRVALQVLGRLNLGKGVSLFVVVADRRRFLVGSGESGPRLLAELGPVGDAATSVRPSRSEPRDGARLPAEVRGAPALLEEALTPLDPGSDDSDGPGTGLVERLRRMTLRTSGRPRVALR